jgi:AraC family transcriptional regulator
MSLDPDQPQSALLPRREAVVVRDHYTVRYLFCDHCEFEPHSHAALTVTSVLSGRMLATIGGSEYEITEGQITLTNVNEMHGARVSSVELVSTYISPAAVSELAIGMGLARTTPEIVFRASVVRDDAVEQTARQIASEARAESFGRGPMLDALVRQLVIYLLRSHLTVRKSAHIELSRAGPVDRRLRRAIEFMHDNYSSDLGLGEIAAAAYLSEYHFARLFKQITGITPHGYLANLRLERARKLLAETSFPISQIAAMVGYQSQSHFTKIFKSITGITPRAYRDSVKHL